MTNAQTSRAKNAADKPAFFSTTAVADFLDTVTERHEKLAAGVKETHDRATRLAGEFTDALLTGQREWLGVVRKLAGNPTDFGANSRALMDAAAAAQERSLAFGKLVYGEQAQAGAEARKFVESVFATTGFKPLSAWVAKAE